MIARTNLCSIEIIPNSNYHFVTRTHIFLFYFFRQTVFLAQINKPWDIFDIAVDVDISNISPQLIRQNAY